MIRLNDQVFRNRFIRLTREMMGMWREVIDQHNANKVEVDHHFDAWRNSLLQRIFSGSSPGGHNYLSVKENQAQIDLCLAFIPSESSFALWDFQGRLGLYMLSKCGVLMTEEQTLRLIELDELDEFCACLDFTLDQIHSY